MTSFIISARSRPDWKSARFRLWPKAERHEQVWNSTFSMPYREFRYELQQIAAENHRRVRGAVFGRPKYNAVVIPVDDDDWFSPELVERLRASLRPASAGAYWVSHELINGSLTTGSNQGCKFCKTNSYCYRPASGRKSWYHHVGAEKAFREELQIQFLERPLSMVNRTLGSFTALEYKIPTGKLADYWESTVTNFKSLEIPSHLSWAQVYVDRTRDLISRLR